MWTITDPFWQDNQPGEEWGCQCDWEATDDPVTDNSDLQQLSIKPSKGLGGNPGATGELFSQDHPYFPVSCKVCPFRSKVLSLFTNKTKDCYHCQNIIKALQEAKLKPIIKEYERLKADPNYSTVKLDKQSGGVSAIHKEHKFDSVKGIFGIKRGDYERLTVDVLRKNGYKVILGSEQAANGVKTPDGTLNDIVMDIKAIESTGKWTVVSKFENANKQGARCVVLYFHDRSMFSKEYVLNSWRAYLTAPYRNTQHIENIICVVENEYYNLEL